MKRIFFFVGLPCAGKTYAANVIADKFFDSKCTKVSTGDIARSLVTTQELQVQMAAKDLFPIEEPLREEMRRQIEASTANNVIVDGFPRFGDQADYLIDNFWIYHPTVIEISVGDTVTLYNRAKLRGRDTRDGMREFQDRLSKAQANMADAFSVLSRRLCPHYTILSGSDESIIAQFKRWGNK